MMTMNRMTHEQPAQPASVCVWTRWGLWKITIYSRCRLQLKHEVQDEEGRDD